MARERRERRRMRKPRQDKDDPPLTHIVPLRTSVLTDAMTLGSLGTREIVTVGSLNVSAALSQSAAVANVYSPALTAATLLTQISDFTAVFDQYKILAIEITMKPRTNVSGFGNGTVAAFMQGSLYSVLDYDDSATLGSIGAALAYDNCIQTEVYDPNRRCFKPRMAMASYVGTFTGFANAADQWIDAASTSVAHYGVKFIADAGTTAALQVWDAQIRTKVAWRAVR